MVVAVLVMIGVEELLVLVGGEAVTVGLTRTVAVDTRAPRHLHVSHVRP